MLLEIFQMYAKPVTKWKRRGKPSFYIGDVSLQLAIECSCFAFILFYFF